MVNSSQFTSEMNTAVMVLRALLNSSQTKDGIPSKQLLVDYQNVNGKALPLKKFGFDTIEDFLTATNDFILQRGRDGVRVMVRAQNDSTHIRKYIDQQKTNSVRKQKSPVVQPVLQPRRQPIQTQSSRDENKFRSASAFSDIYSRLPTRSATKAAAATVQRVQPKKASPGKVASTSAVVSANGNGTATPELASKRAITKQNARPPQKHEQQQQQQQKVSASQSLSPTASSFKSSSTPSPPSPPSPPVMAASNGRPAAAARNFNNNVLPRECPSIVREPRLPSGTAPKLFQRPSLNSRLTRHQNAIDEPEAVQNNQQAAVNHAANASNAASGAVNNILNNRLTRLQASSATTPTDKTHPSDISAAVNKRSLEIEHPMKSGDMNTSESHRALVEYCKKNGFGQPQYKFYCIKKTKRIHCRVQVNNCLYATYPNDFATEAEAKADVARTALAQLKDPNTKQQIPICMDSDIELAIKILNCIKTMTNGVFKKNIPQIFRDAYNQALPENWFDIIVDNQLMFNIEDAVNEHKIIYPSCSETIAPMPVDTALDETDNRAAPAQLPLSMTNDFVQADELILPWSEKYWNLYMTHPKTTVEIWARIIGPEYSTKMDSLITDIELSMLTDKKRADRIIEGQIYLVSITECWYRVRVDKNDNTKRRCHCFLIDVGDSDWFAMDEIYLCEAKFQRFPAQAVCFSLFGLEDFAGNPHATHQIDEMLANKVLIGEILTKSDDYIAQEKSNDLQAKIQMELYDTSSQEDVRLNPLILDRICENTVEPHLDRQKLNLVFISHVNDNAEIYCHLQQGRGSLHYINKVIHQLTETGMQCEKFRMASAVHTKNRYISQSMYLILDKAEEQWYRASVQWDRSANKTNQMEICKCVDYGYEKCVEWGNLYRLDVLSAALNKFPAQAIAMKLHDIQEINANVIGRLRGLLLPNTISANTAVQSDASTFVNVVEGSLMPVVNIFKRMLPSNILYRINDTIRMEQELEKCADIIPEPEDTFDRTNMVSNVGQMDMPGIKQYPRPPLDQFFNVFVSMASNPSNFVVRPHNDEKTFRLILAELQLHCSQSNDIPTKDQLIPAHFFAALNQDGTWYRVYLEKCLGSSMAVFNCDFGDMFIVDAANLRMLPEKFRQLPQMAIRARLCGVQPKNKDWNTNDCTRFQELTVGKSFASEIKSIQDDNQKYTIDLLLIDVSTTQDIFLDKVLIDEGRAVKI